MFAGTHRVCYSFTLLFFTCTKTPSHAPQAELIFAKKIELFTQSEFFLFFFSFNGLVCFFSVSVNKGGQKVKPRWKQQRLLLRDDCTALLLLLAFKRHLDFLETFYGSELLLVTGQRW